MSNRAAVSDDRAYCVLQKADVPIALCLRCPYLDSVDEQSVRCTPTLLATDVAASAAAVLRP
jgi:hypothetical protein